MPLPTWLTNTFITIYTIIVAADPILIDNNIITAHTGALIGAGVAIFASAFHLTPPVVNTLTKTPTQTPNNPVP